MEVNRWRLGASRFSQDGGRIAGLARTISVVGISEGRPYIQIGYSAYLLNRS
jgi:hypothetical protein